MSTTATYAACPQMRAPAGNGACRRCGAALVPPRSWCSQTCADWWLDNHDWGSARAAALRRDGQRCVRCNHPGDYVGQVDALVAALTNTDRTGLTLLLEHGEEAAALAVVVRLARMASTEPRWGAVLAEAEQAAATLTAGDDLATLYRRFAHLHRLEVNHVEPRRGRGYALGCHNHLANLETLCHPCHVTVTAEQRAAGLLAA